KRRVSSAVSWMAAQAGRWRDRLRFLFMWETGVGIRGGASVCKCKNGVNDRDYRYQQYSQESDELRPASG
ncbi:hypothetical protein, partial [Pseudomonas aeruginosa]